MAKPYLIDKFILISHPDEKLMSVFRVKERLMPDLYVLRPYCSSHGEEPNLGDLVIDIEALVCDPTELKPRVLIFESVEVVNAYIEVITADDDKPDEAQLPALLN